MAIISLVTVAIYRFVKANLTAISVSQAAETERLELTGLIDYLQTQLEDLPARQPGVLLGTPGKVKGMPADELQWLCRAGQGVLTTSGPSQYRVTLALQPVTKTSGELEIGLRRQATNIDERNYNWLTLLRPAAGLEVRYYDERLNAWIERWNDVNLLPRLVRIRVWRTADGPPIEAVVPLPAARTQGVIQ